MKVYRPDTGLQTNLIELQRSSGSVSNAQFLGMLLFSNVRNDQMKSILIENARAEIDNDLKLLRVIQNIIL